MSKAAVNCWRRGVKLDSVAVSVLTRLSIRIVPATRQKIQGAERASCDYTNLRQDASGGGLEGADDSQNLRHVLALLDSRGGRGNSRDSAEGEESGKDTSEDHLGLGLLVDWLVCW